MKKKVLLVAAALCFGFATMAQIPTPPTKSGISEVPTPPNPSGEGNQTHKAPVAPATLLLLSLAGGAAGVKLYRNSKSNN